MQAIGQAYLDDFSDDRRRRGVVDEVSHTLEKIDIDESTQGIRKQLFSEIRTDFESEDLTAVGGWWLATTEVHICTVASLLEE